MRTSLGWTRSLASMRSDSVAPLNFVDDGHLILPFLEVG